MAGDIAQLTCFCQILELRLGNHIYSIECHALLPTQRHVHTVADEMAISRSV